MDTFRISELQELEEEFAPAGVDMYSGPDTAEPLTDAEMAMMDAAYRRDDRMQNIRHISKNDSVGYEDEDEDEYNGVRPLDFV